MCCCLQASGTLELVGLVVTGKYALQLYGGPVKRWVDGWVDGRPSISSRRRRGSAPEMLAKRGVGVGAHSRVCVCV